MKHFSSTVVVAALLAASTGGAVAQSGALSRNQVARMSASQRRYAINRLYAKHGWVFSDMSVRRQFLKFDWYRPVPGRTLAQVKARFSRGERISLQRLSVARDDDSSFDDEGYHSPYAGKPDMMRGERFPETRIRLMSRAQVERMSDAQLRYAINEIYARKGYYFADAAIRRHFNNLGWTSMPPDVTMDEIRDDLTDIESANLETLSSERDSR